MTTRPMMSSAPPSDLLCDDERSTSTVLRGPWTIELRAGELENIRHHGRLVLRSVRAVVRDENWRTVPSVVERIDGLDETSGPLTIEARTRDERVSLAWRLQISTEGDELKVVYRAEAESDFLRNRLGLIVLHSPDLAETAFDVRHSDGSTTRTAFPGAISPHQPAVDIRGLDWVVVDDDRSTRCSLDLSGDVFEMEDQRNWTDASYKTYSTPLGLPFPVSVRSGDIVEQSLVLRCVAHDEPTEESAPYDGPREAELSIGRIVPDVVVPELTTTASTAPEPALKQGAPAWARILLVEVDPLWANWRAALDRAVADADGRRLDVRLVADGVDEVAPVLDALAEHPSSMFARIGLFARTNHFAHADTARALLGALDARSLDVQVIAGTRAHFTELNRAIERLESWRGPITFSITPFMHDTAGHQLVESIAMQREVAINARRLAGDRPLHIGPITVGARFNAVATTPAPVPTRDDLGEGYGAALVPGATDTRTRSASMAAWLLASVAALAQPKVLTLSYLEEWGPRSASHPAAAQVLTWLSELAGSPVREASAPGFAVLAVGGDEDRATVVLLGNLDSEPRSVLLPGSRVPIVIGPGEVRRFVGLAAPPRG
jgi:hypothetical protein